jgi:hypothetical protein
LSQFVASVLLLFQPITTALGKSVRQERDIGQVITDILEFLGTVPTAVAA